MDVELTWQLPDVILPSFSTRIGIPGAIDIVVLSGEIFSICFFLQCRNIGPKLTFCIFSLFIIQIVTPNTEQFQYICYCACYIWALEGLDFSKWPGLFS